MAKTTPGPDPKGVRRQHTVRIPEDQFHTYEHLARELGLPLGDYIVMHMAVAHGLPIPDWIKKRTAADHQLQLGA